MDITIDCGNLYFGLNSVRKLEDDLTLLQNAINKIDLSSELPSASSLESAMETLKSVLQNDVDDLVVRLDNTKRILRENDQEAAYLFNFYEEGIINGDFEFTEMPLMDQTDYKNIKYSQGTISTSGCGLTSVCMVASYLTGNLYTPAELVEATRGKSNNVDRMLAAADSLGLVWHNDSSTSNQDLLNYLKEGKIAIVLVRDSSHFVVCTGVTEDDKVLVNDPYGPRATDQALTLSELDFTAGNTWIFDPAENQHVKEELDDSITVSGSTADAILNESGYIDRTDRGVLPDDVEVELRENTTEAPTSAPTTPKTEAPTSAPTTPKTEAPTSVPTTPKTEASTSAPTTPKTEVPTSAPTTPKTEAPTSAPTTPKTEAPTSAPTTPKTEAPTSAPTTPKTEAPTSVPTTPKTEAPTSAPTTPKTEAPTSAPTTPKTEAPTSASQVNTSDSYSDTVSSSNTGYSDTSNTNVGDNTNSDDIILDDSDTSDNNDYDYGYDDYDSEVNNDADDYTYPNTDYPNEDVIKSDNDNLSDLDTEVDSSSYDWNKLLIPGILGTTAVAGATAYAVTKNKKSKNKKLELDDYDDEYNDEYDDDEI